MKLWLANVIRFGAVHHQPIGWGSSIAVHGMGVLLASVSFLAISDRAAQLPGHLTATNLELQASFAEPQQSRPVEIVPPDPQVLVMPHRVRVDDQSFTPASTDVSRPTPEELALAEQLLATASTAARRRTDVTRPTQPQAAAAATATATRRVTPAQVVARPVPPSRPVVPQETSVGTTEERLAKPLENRPPVYPSEALRNQLEGVVFLRVHVADTGRVVNVEVLRSSGHPILDGAAVQAVGGWRFLPAMQAGRAVASTVRIPVRFSLNDR